MSNNTYQQTSPLASIRGYQGLEGAAPLHPNHLGALHFVNNSKNRPNYFEKYTNIIYCNEKYQYRFFRFSGEPDFFSLKPSPERLEDNDVNYSPIGSVVFKLLSVTHRHTHRQTHTSCYFRIRNRISKKMVSKLREFLEGGKVLCPPPSLNPV